MRLSKLAYITAALILSACAKDNPYCGSFFEYDYENFDSVLSKTRIDLSINESLDSDNSLSKTFIKDNNIYFSANDRFSVFDSELNNNKFYVTYLSLDQSKCTITGYAYPSESYYVLFPYQDNAKSVDTAIVANLPSVQTATAGTYDTTAFLALAYAQSSDMVFKNVCSLMKFTSDDNYTQLKIQSLAKEPISGEVCINMDSDGNPQCSFGTNVSSSITLIGKILKGETYYIAFVPTTLKDGLLLELTDNSGKVLRKCINKTMTLARNKVYKLDKPQNTRMLYYVGNGADNPPSAVELADTNVIPSRGKMLYKNHKYLGWSLSVDESETYMHKGDTIPFDKDDESDVILYAHWKDVTEDLNGYDYVDMGFETGLLWATANVGASTYSEAGGYYAWGETETKDYSYYWFNNYKWNESGHYWPTNILKYNRTDSITTLELEDDAAHVVMQGGWRTPTQDEYKYAMSNCIVGLGFIGSSRYCNFISNINGNAFHLYPCGVINSNHGGYNGANSGYWTSTFAYGCLADFKDSEAIGFSFYISTGNVHKAMGQNVRAVL